MHRNIREAQAVWRRLGKMLRREGEDRWVLSLFYREVT